MKVLVVHDPFSVPAADGGEPRSYVRGDMIRKPAEMQAVRDGGLDRFCTSSDVADDFFQSDPPAPSKARSAPAAE